MGESSDLMILLLGSSRAANTGYRQHHWSDRTNYQQFVIRLTSDLQCLILFWLQTGLNWTYWPIWLADRVLNGVRPICAKFVSAKHAQWTRPIVWQDTSDVCVVLDTDAHWWDPGHLPVYVESLHHACLAVLSITLCGRIRYVINLSNIWWQDRMGGEIE